MPLDNNQGAWETAGGEETAGLGDLQFAGAQALVPEINGACRLRSGDYLLACQKNGTVYRYSPEEEATEVVCRFLNSTMVLWGATCSPDGRVYCALSGGRRKNFEVVFGQGGAIVEITPQQHKMRIVADETLLRDPCSIRFQDDGSLLVVDFEGFGGKGQICTVNLFNSEKTSILQGVPLRDPLAFCRSKAADMFVSNAIMHYDYDVNPDGTVGKDSSQILKFSPAGQFIEKLYDEGYNPKGAVIGLELHNNQQDLVMVRGDWPGHQTGAILVLDLKSNAVRQLKAVDGVPRFFSARLVLDGNEATVVDNFMKELVTVDLYKDKIVRKTDLKHILGQTIGVLNPCETVQSIELVP